MASASTSTPFNSINSSTPSNPGRSASAPAGADTMFPPASSFASKIKSFQPLPFDPVKDEIESLTLQFDNLCAFAQEQVEAQPLATQRTLAKQTGDVFNRYREHGTLARLEHSLMEFLTAKEEPERMKIDEHVLGRVLDSADGEDGSDDNSDDSSGEESETDNNEVEPGEYEMEIDYQDNDLVESMIPTPLRQPSSDSTPQDTQSKTLSTKGKGKSRCQTRRELRTIDKDSTNFTISLPFHPIDTDLLFPPDIALPPAYLAILNNIYGLYAEEGRALLKHHTTKYGPAPIFRAGIREYITSQLETIVVPARHDGLSLTVETRVFLRGLYEERNGGELNVAEKRMVGQVCGIAVRTVDVFWEDMAVRRRAWMGMREFVLAREIEKIRVEREMGRVGEMRGPARVEQRRVRTPDGGMQGCIIGIIDRLL